MFSILFSGLLFSQTIVSVYLQKTSWLAIYGTTNILSFKLVYDGEKLPGEVITLTITQNHNKIYSSKNQLSIVVKNFTSENKMALKDFYKLLKSETYPDLKVQLDYKETHDGKGKNQYCKGNAFVNITITGVTRQFHIPVTSNQLGENISVDGGKKINIQDFGLEAPVGMFGIIKVSDWINIDFHIVFKLTFGNDTKNVLPE